MSNTTEDIIAGVKSSGLEISQNHSILEKTFNQCYGVEKEFKNRAVLFIGSESYDSATITIIDGLNLLGFKIYVYKKGNINSWFCNKVINSLFEIENEIDFVLSNLHWGTRWSLYGQLYHQVPLVLIDGDDRLHGNVISNWSVKYDHVLKTSKRAPENIKNMELSPFRWAEEMIGELDAKDINDNSIKVQYKYKPDIVFMSQKYKINKDEIYLPFGIHSNYIEQTKEIKNTLDRKIDICNIPGPGAFRAHMVNLVNNNFGDRNVWNKLVYGEMIVDNKIKEYCEQDSSNIHSWHRWRICKDYHNILLDSKISIISLIDKYNAPGWESKRAYEALAYGSFVMFERQPDFDNSSYPLQEICEDVEFDYQNYNQLIEKITYLLNNPKILEAKRQKSYQNALKYFTSVPITRYFLFNIKSHLLEKS
jgi:hypothetical protein